MRLESNERKGNGEGKGVSKGGRGRTRRNSGEERRYAREDKG